jgi:hypothetical protein
MSVVGILLLPLALSIVSTSQAQPAPKIECVAGCGGSLDGTAKGARLIEPFGVAFDRRGNLYICEYKGQRITKVDTKGSITLFAGGNGRSSEGSARGQLEFNIPAKGFSTHSESSSLGGEEFGRGLRLRGNKLLIIESIYLYNAH